MYLVILSSGFDLALVSVIDFDKTCADDKNTLCRPGLICDPKTAICSENTNFVFFSISIFLVFLLRRYFYASTKSFRGYNFITVCLSVCVFVSLSGSA